MNHIWALTYRNDFTLLFYVSNASFKFKTPFQTNLFFASQSSPSVFWMKSLRDHLSAGQQSLEHQCSRNHVQLLQLMNASDVYQPCSDVTFSHQDQTNNTRHNKPCKLERKYTHHWFRLKPHTTLRFVFSACFFQLLYVRLLIQPQLQLQVTDWKLNLQNVTHLHSQHQPKTHTHCNCDTCCSKSLCDTFFGSSFFGSSVIAGHGLPPVTAGIGVWLDGVGQVGMYYIAEQMSKRTRLHRRQEGIPVNNGTRIEGVLVRIGPSPKWPVMCREGR